MKKILYILLFVCVTSATITSCTEETVKPKADNSGGNASDPIIK